jgi:hypothetical protein
MGPFQTLPSSTKTNRNATKTMRFSMKMGYEIMSLAEVLGARAGEGDGGAAG